MRNKLLNGIIKYLEEVYGRKFPMFRKNLNVPDNTPPSREIIKPIKVNPISNEIGKGVMLNKNQREYINAIISVIKLDTKLPPLITAATNRYIASHPELVLDKLGDNAFKEIFKEGKDLSKILDDFNFSVESLKSQKALNNDEANGLKRWFKEHTTEQMNSVLKNYPTSNFKRLNTDIKSLISTDNNGKIQFIDSTFKKLWVNAAPSTKSDMAFSLINHFNNGLKIASKRKNIGDPNSQQFFYDNLSSSNQIIVKLYMDKIFSKADFDLAKSTFNKIWGEVEGKRIKANPIKPNNGLKK